MCTLGLVELPKMSDPCSEQDGNTLVSSDLADLDRSHLTTYSTAISAKVRIATTFCPGHDVFFFGAKRLLDYATLLLGILVL
jgi:hypothetical protein